MVASLPFGGQNAGMPLRLRPPGICRRSCLLAALPWLPGPAQATDTPLREAMRRAEALRDELIVGAAPSRAVPATDPTAHAEMEAIRDAARRQRARDLSGGVLVSTARPCRRCEAAASCAGISRMLYGEALTNAGPPR